ncbi:MAG: DUF4249 domain-containing protein [Chlorobi bacterium]|nr:DUF4249 domain-containing protein [Chlorobiota bacterium]
MCVLIVFPVMFFTGCEKDIEIELKDEGNKSVLYSFIYPDSLFTLHFSKSVGVLSEENYALVKNSFFKLYKNGLYQGKYQFPDDTMAWHWRNFEFEPGDSILLKAIDENRDTAIAQTTIPLIIPVERLDTLSSAYQGADGIAYNVLKCNLTFTDNVYTDDYYQLEIIQERWEVIDGNENYYRQVVDYIKDDPVFYSRSQQGTLMEGIDFKGLFNDELINGRYSLQCLVPDSYYKLYWFDRKIKLTFYLYHHTEEFYRYFRTKLISDYYNGVPIFEPVNVYSNVENGIGLVTGMSFALDSLVFEQEVSP